MVQGIAPDVEDLPGYGPRRRLDRGDEGARDVAAMHVGAPLIAAEDRDLAVHHGAHRQRVDDEVEAHARRQPEHGREAKHDRLQVAGPVEDDVLAQHPRLGIEGHGVEA